MKRTISIITCQPDPDYIRAMVLRGSISSLPTWHVNIIKNHRVGIFRYVEVAYKLWMDKIKNNPDVYLLTFRGYEMLPWLLFVAKDKPVIFDEFINAYEWMVFEHNLIEQNGLVGRIFNAIYSRLLRSCHAVLTDTHPHAALSSRLSKVPGDKYHVIPVGTDEQLFRPHKAGVKSEGFEVFFYGSILPLHGLRTMLDAAILLKDESNISFTFVGIRSEHQAEVNTAIFLGARISYEGYVDFANLPRYMHNASLCLAGPFGNTFQSQYVITGKTFQFLAAGCPTVIGASLASDLFKDRENSLVVPQGNSGALAESILWAQKNPEKLAQIAHAGHELYKAAYSNQVIADLLQPILNSAVETCDSHV